MSKSVLRKVTFETMEIFLEKWFSKGGQHEHMRLRMTMPNPKELE